MSKLYSYWSIFRDVLVPQARLAVKYAFVPRYLQTERINTNVAWRLLTDHRISSYVMVDGEEIRKPANTFAMMRTAFGELSVALEKAVQEIVSNLTQFITGVQS